MEEIRLPCKVMEPNKFTKSNMQAVCQELHSRVELARSHLALHIVVTETETSATSYLLGALSVCGSINKRSRQHILFNRFLLRKIIR